MRICRSENRIEKKPRGERGSITIFLSCILLPLIIAQACIMNLCALLSTKQITNDAGRLASNSALTAYDRDLHDMYGLIAFDNGGAIASSRAVEVFNQNMASNNETNCSVNMSMMSGTTLADKDIFKGQICDAMRYNYKASEKLTAEDLEYFKYYGDSYAVIESKIQYDKKMYTISEDIIGILNEVRDYMDIEEPVELDDETAKSIVTNIKTYSQNVIENKSTLEECRDTWNESLKATNIQPDLKNMMQSYYSEETAYLDYFTTIENLKDDMDYYDSSGDYSGLSYYISTTEYFDTLKEMVNLSDDRDELANRSDWESRMLGEINTNNNNIVYLTMSGGGEIDENDGSFQSIAPNDLEYEDRKAVVADLDTAVENEVRELKVTAESFDSISECQTAINNKDVRYIESEYATEFFGSYHRTDDKTLTGYMFGSKTPGTPLYSEVEYIAYGMESARSDSEQMRDQIYYTFFMAELIGVYYNSPYSNSASSRDYKMEDYYKNDVEILENVQRLADSDLDTVYCDWSGTEIDGNSSTTKFTFAHFMKLYTLMAVVKNEDVVLQRMRYVIETNVGAASGESFTFDDAYTAATINATINVNGVIGNGTSYNYDTVVVY